MCTPHHRRGYTLVELLTVIGIIVLLSSLIVRAIIYALYRARIVAIAIDTQTLGSAMFELKSNCPQYPPDMGDLSYASRQSRFDNFVGVAHPQGRITYNTLKNYILTNYQSAYGYNYRKPDGSLAPLNLDTLDQAEALVFWLGGFPMPYNSQGVPLGQGKLCGFNTNRASPFQLGFGSAFNPAIRMTQTVFDDQRLVDNDHDGWLEYIPPGPCKSTNGLTPPYVYFDGSGYTQVWPDKSTPAFVGYPMARPGDPNTQGASLINAWGVAVPYARDFTNIGAPFAQWIKPKEFQIVSASLDGAYGKPGVAQVRIPCLPSGATFAAPGFSQGYFDNEELDNVTNFTQSTIEDSAAR